MRRPPTAAALLAALLAGCAAEWKTESAAPPADAPAFADQPPAAARTARVPEPVDAAEALTAADAASGGSAGIPLFGDAPLRLPGGGEVVRVYYGTNRRRSEAADGLRDPDAYYTADPGPLEFGVLEVSVPGCHEPGELERPRWYTFEREDATRHVVLQRIAAVTPDVFAGALRADVARDPTREAFVFVHGFNVAFAEAAWRAGQMKADLDFAGPAVLYSWPSLGLPDPISYGRDQRRAADSRDELMAFLTTVADRSGASKLHVIAHSMGNEVLVPALAAVEARPGGPMIGQLILAAPDIDAEAFRDTIAAKLDKCAARTTVYAADHDVALTASVAINRTPRLGLMRSLMGRGVGDWPHVDLVDASPVSFRLFELGHSDYGGPLLEDVKAALAGLPTSQRLLEAHRRVPRGWLVVDGGGVRAEPVVVTPPPPEPTLWARMTGWWPF